MQDELQPIKLTLWKQVKNRRQHLSSGTRGELLSRYRPAERAERSPFASPGFGPKIRNSNEGLWRKSLWDGDTWSRWGALLTQRKGGTRGWRREVGEPLAECTHRMPEQCVAAGRMALACFFAIREEGRGVKKGPGSSSHGQKMCGVEKKIATASDGTHARRICKPGFTGSEFLSQAYVFLLRVRGKPLAWCARENITNGGFKNAATYFCGADGN